MSDSLTDLAGLGAGAEDFLAAVLDTVAQPIWVVDPEGLIRFANPAAIAALGYDRAGELVGRPSHETIHYRHPDGMPYPAADCPMLLPRTTGETVARDLDWFFRRDGSMFPVSYVSAPIAMPKCRGAVVAFTDIEDRSRAEQALREREAVLAAHEGSLRRIATLVAGGAASAEVFAAIAREVGEMLGLPLVQIWRFEADGTATVLGAWNEHAQPFKAGSRWSLDGSQLSELVQQTGRPARIDDIADAPAGPIADAVREAGIRSGAGAPIIVDGEMWGLMAANPEAGVPLPDQIENRLADFTELLATAISNTASREELARLADEQAALRRVATLVAREAPPDELFAAVVEEVARVLPVAFAAMGRYESDGTMTTVATSGRLGARLPAGSRSRRGGDNVSTVVFETGRSVRIDGSVGAPIIVERGLWGLISASANPELRLPADTEARLANFAELVATAISNTEARAEAAASRARIVAATDEERRRVVRDLHDGAQQRLVHTIITLKLAQRALQNEEEDASRPLSEALDHAEQAHVELRELAHGILPAALTEGGLRAGVDALASRMPVPVENGVSVGRLPTAVEATAYFVVAEALTNVAKHAHAGHAGATAWIEDGTLVVEVRDDGVGGARAEGSGLVGLGDRLAVLDGRLWVESPAGGGTLVAAAIPLRASVSTRTPTA